MKKGEPDFIVVRCRAMGLPRSRAIGSNQNQEKIRKKYE